MIVPIGRANWQPGQAKTGYSGYGRGSEARARLLSHEVGNDHFRHLAAFDFDLWVLGGRWHHRSGEHGIAAARRCHFDRRRGVCRYDPSAEYLARDCRCSGGGDPRGQCRFWIGREIGYRLLLRYGRYVRLTEPRIKLGQYLFRRHGGKIVFFGRFIAVLRALAALLAGANAMSWPRFLLFNAAGAIAWAALYGGAAYYFGHELQHVTKAAAFGLTALAVVAIGIVLVIVRRHETELEQIAERALPRPAQGAWIEGFKALCYRTGPPGKAMTNAMTTARAKSCGASSRRQGAHRRAETEP